MTPIFVLYNVLTPLAPKQKTLLWKKRSSLRGGIPLMPNRQKLQSTPTLHIAHESH
jgi:hypothetical protein